MRILKHLYHDVIADPFGLSEELARLEAEMNSENTRDAHGNRLPADDWSEEEFQRFEGLFEESGVRA